MKRLVTQIALLLLAASFVTSASAQNGVMHFEYPLVIAPDDPIAYAACIDDGVGLDLTIFEKFHFVQTPNGNTHVVSNWRIEGMAAGAFSGWNWFVHGTSPLTANAQGDQSAQNAGVNLTLEPLDGGPKLLARQRLRRIENANGEVQVFLLSNEWRCIGQPD